MNMNADFEVEVARLPFRNAVEAMTNAAALCRAFEIHNVCILNRERRWPIRIGLDETRCLTANALGYAEWDDLTLALGRGVEVVYFNEHPRHQEIIRAFATSIAGKLGSVKLYGKIKSALDCSAFGCSSNRRGQAYREMVSPSHTTLADISKLMRLDGRYVSKYYPSLSEFDYLLLHGLHIRSVAEILAAPRGELS